MQQPTRPARAVRPRNDENAVPAVKAATLKSVAPGKENAVVKGEAKRRACGEISKQVTATSKTASLKDKDPQNAPKANKIELKEKDQIAVKNALGRPAQRGTSRSTTSTTHTAAATTSHPKTTIPGPARRLVKKTEVYTDKRSSPPKVTATKALSPKKVSKSPKAKAGHIIQREARKVGRYTVSGSITYKNSRFDISNQLALSHIQDGDVGSAELPAEETDDDATDVEGDENQEALSDEEDQEGEEDDDDFTTARSKPAGDNTTGVTAQLLCPRYTAGDRKELIEAGKDFKEICEDDVWDITMVAEYGDEIFEYMRKLEAKMMPNPNYMDDQPEIQWSMRSILIDWIVQVHNRFGLLPETLFLTCNYIDRFLSAKVVSINKLQLVGATALFIAAKYEEIQCPSVHEIVFMVDNGYTVAEILAAEKFMLSMLQFELGWPGPMSFLRRVSKADDYDLESRTLAKYFLELTIMDERFVGSPPSFLAAGAHYLARSMLQKGDWTTGHTHFSGYTANQLLPLVRTLYECCENPKLHHAAIFEKYQDRRRYKAASLYVQKYIKANGTSFTLE